MSRPAPHQSSSIKHLQKSQKAIGCLLSVLNLCANYISNPLNPYATIKSNVDLQLPLLRYRPTLRLYRPRQSWWEPGVAYGLLAGWATDTVFLYPFNGLKLYTHLKSLLSIVMMVSLYSKCNTIFELYIHLNKFITASWAKWVRLVFVGQGTLFSFHQFTRAQCSRPLPPPVDIPTTTVHFS